MGTNDVRHGTTDVAVDNFNLVKASVETNKTASNNQPQWTQALITHLMRKNEGGNYQNEESLKV